MSSFQELRREYARSGLEESDLAPDPVAQFESWFQEARDAGLPLPDSMTLATCDAQGVPNARIVVLRGIDAAGLVFYTNYQSEKGRELEAEPRATLLFHWVEPERQVRVRGRVTKTTREESRRYFQGRPRESRIAAAASPQSRVIANRADLEASFDRLETRHEGEEIPLPGFWGGYRLQPESWEFWQGRARRLHDRLRYRRERSGAWHVERLAP